VMAVFSPKTSNRPTRSLRLLASGPCSHLPMLGVPGRCTGGGWLKPAPFAHARASIIVPDLTTVPTYFHWRPVAGKYSINHCNSK